MKRYLRTILRGSMIGVSICIYYLKRLPAFLKWFILRATGVLAFVFVTILYVVSLPVPIIGRVLLKSNSKVDLPDFDIADRVETFREDMMEIMVKKHTPNSGRSSHDLKSEIEFRYWKAKKNHELGEIVISFWGGIIALLLGVFGYWEAVSYVLSGYILIITFSILLRIVILELLAYENADGYIRKRELELRLGWQRAILTSSRSQLLILFLGFVGIVHSPSYRIGMDMLDRHYEKGMKKRKWIEILRKEIRGQSD
ncbi:hypothetical protein HTZ84_04895 [Haloterrigena sp. SYSU A558-1]|uniref:Uncharacterized protein n=1 Tax=Haloterrigena gelatinilytica TaxID=2741724 RepID=A0ABX2L8G5_9EURY|nr:hypothetical protein [Haloterrigena gelatinilytica]NUC71653.1 hypothetical protein [Haloterrigena gelatinilytica]